jgi:GT2 family glycosyltransferase
MLATIIISSVDRKQVMQRLFSNIAAQSVLPDEIILVEAGKTTWSEIDIPVVFHGKTTFLHETGLALSAARALGQKQSHGDILFFLDDDIIIPETYISDAINYLQNHNNIMAIGGCYSDQILSKRNESSILIGRLLGIYSDGNKNMILPSGWADYVRGDATQKISCADWLFGCNFVVKSEAFSKANFEEGLAAWSFLEDVFFGIHLKNSFGDCMRILPSLKVIHDPPCSGGRITLITLKMRILYRYILWRDHLYNHSIHAVLMFLLGMIANLLLMLKQEKKFWVISATFSSLYKIVRHPKMNLEFANEIIFEKI